MPKVDKGIFLRALGFLGFLGFLGGPNPAYAGLACLAVIGGLALGSNQKVS